MRVHARKGTHPNEQFQWAGRDCAIVHRPAIFGEMYAKLYMHISPNIYIVLYDTTIIREYYTLHNWSTMSAAIGGQSVHKLNDCERSNIKLRMGNRIRPAAQNSWCRLPPPIPKLLYPLTHLFIHYENMPVAPFRCHCLRSLTVRLCELVQSLRLVCVLRYSFAYMCMRQAHSSHLYLALPWVAKSESTRACLQFSGFYAHTRIYTIYTKYMAAMHKLPPEKFVCGCTCACSSAASSSSIAAASMSTMTANLGFNINPGLWHVAIQRLEHISVCPTTLLLCSANMQQCLRSIRVVG